MKFQLQALILGVLEPVASMLVIGNFRSLWLVIKWFMKIFDKFSLVLV